MILDNSTPAGLLQRLYIFNAMYELPADVKKAADKAADKINEATPNLSANPFDDLLGKVSHSLLGTVSSDSRAECPARV